MIQRQRVLATSVWPGQAWNARVDTIAGTSTPRVIREVVARAADYETVVLNGSLHRDQLAGLLLARRRRPPNVVMLDATWKLSGNPLDRAAMRACLRMLDGPHVTYCVLSTFEQQTFPRNWGVDAARVVVTHWPHTLTHDELNEPVDESLGVVALGDSLRDYATLIRAAAMTSVPITIATRTLPRNLRASLPDNVLAGPVSPARFEELMRRAAVIVVPLAPRDDRSAGQTTFVNAMARGKAVIVSATPGTDEYVSNGDTGVLVPPADPVALCRAIERLIDDPALARRIAERARSYARDQLSPQRYVGKVLNIIDSMRN